MSTPEAKSVKPIPTIGRILSNSMETNKTEVNNKCDTYLEFYDKKKQSEQKMTSMRKENSTTITDHYYDLATDFYEYGWGESFHFAPICKGDTKEQSFARHEYQLALRLGIQKGDKVVDFGCGIGGPARNIAAFTEANIVGININDYQIQRATDLTKKANLDHLVTYHKSDFTNISLPDASFDRAFSIEATCHCNDKPSVYGEAYRLLKPGGYFAVYEWLMTDKYDPKNAYHKRIKEDIMEGDALPDIETKEVALEAMKSVGFEVVDHYDLADKGDSPWYTMLMPRWTLADFKITPMGRWATHLMLFSMEVVGFAPKGAVKVHRMLCKGADGLVKGGKEGIFTPMYFIICRKPENPPTSKK